MAKKRARIIAAILVALLVVGIVYAYELLPNVLRWERGYDQIEKGDSKQRVVDLLGKPTEVRACQFPTRAYDENCGEEYWYNAPMQEWIIVFDKDGKVMLKAHSVSP
jgi:hypothetical protein